MQMTKEEIVRNYKESSNPQKQIKILADLNACSKEYIEEIIEEANKKLEIPELPIGNTEQPKRRGRKPKAVLQGDDQPEKIKEEPDEEIKECLDCKITEGGRIVQMSAPDHVMKQLQDELESVDEQIKALEKRYKDIVTAMQVVGSLNN